MWCVVLVAGLVRVEVGDTALLVQSAAAGEPCGGGRGACVDPAACAAVVPKLSFQAWAVPKVAWCFPGLSCCAEKRPEFSGLLRLPDGASVSLRVHDHTTVAQLYAMADDALRERGPVPDYKLEFVSGAFGTRTLERGSGTTLQDLGVVHPHFFELSVTLRLRGGIANGDTPSWSHVPFVVKLQASYRAVDPKDGVTYRYTKTCTGTLVGPYVFSAAHCFQGRTSDPSVWTALVYRPASGPLSVGDAVVVWDDSGPRKDATVTSVARALFGQRVKALPVGWEGPDGFDWDHFEAAGQQTLEVTAIWNHDRYDRDTDTHDFAVLAVRGAGWTPPTPPLLDASDTALSRPVLFAGFGEREDGDSGELRTAQLDTERCPAYERDSHFTVRCASSGPSSAVTTCVGDSGGPVFYNADASGALDYGRTAVRADTQYVLTASNSFGYMAGCGDPRKKTGVSMLARNRAFIERVVPAEQQRAWLTWV